MPEKGLDLVTLAPRAAHFVLRHWTAITQIVGRGHFAVVNLGPARTALRYLSITDAPLHALKGVEPVQAACSQAILSYYFCSP